MRLIPRLHRLPWPPVVPLGLCHSDRFAPQTSPPVAAAQQEAFVIAANPLAAQAGMEVLKRGGSAVDAAIAVQAMLSLVEPQSSGLGGGAFMTYYDAAPARSAIYDGREVAPAQATPTMFLRADGTPLPFSEAVLSGRATGVPGVVRDAGRRASGAWQAAVEQPVRRRRADRARRLHRQPAARPAGRAATSRRTARPTSSPISRKPDGTLRRRPATGCAIRPMPTSSAGSPSQGPAALYAGSTAARIVARTRAAPLGGSMTMADLASLPAGQARGAVPALPRLCRLRPAAAVERRRAAAAAEAARADRHRRRAGRAIRRPGSCSPRRAGSCTPTATAMSAIRLRRTCRSTGLLDPAYVALARAADRQRPPARRRPPAARRAPQVAAADTHARADRNVAFHRPRCGRQRRVDDDHGRIDLRVGPNGRRLLPQQPDDRLLLQAASTPRAGRRPMRSRRASGRARR